MNGGITQSIINKWKTPGNLVLHWDKITSTLDGTSKEKLFPVVVFRREEIKILGIRYIGKILKNYVKVVCNAVAGLLRKWECFKNIIALSFDTTSSNTGHISGACIIIQKCLGKAMLWLLCKQAPYR